jgi:hypothetical protein
MGKYRISFIIDGRNIAIDDKKMSFIVDKILTQPFGTYTKMSLETTDSNDSLVSFNESLFRSVFSDTTCLHAFAGGMPGEISFDFKLKGSIHITSESRYIKFLIDRDDFVKINGPEKIYYMFLSIAKQFSQLTNANLQVVESEKFYEKTEMRVIKGPHRSRYLDWIHILGPSAYSPAYTKEELLNAPAYRVEEWENDVVFMMCYEKPFEYDLPENIERVRAITDYLRGKKRVVQIE